jgi:hypothetical protein
MHPLYNENNCFVITDDRKFWTFPRIFPPLLRGTKTKTNNTSARNVNKFWGAVWFAQKHLAYKKISACSRDVNTAEGIEREFRHKDYLQFLQQVWAQSKHGHANYTSESGDVPFAPRCRLINYKSLQRVNSQGLKRTIFHSELQTIKDILLGRTQLERKNRYKYFVTLPYQNCAPARPSRFGKYRVNTKTLLDFK